jgi:serine/threonine protein phosphatase 1
LLEAINFDYSKDIMYQTGDLADRGPHSRRCLALIREPWFRAVRGNHEHELLKAAATPQYYNWTHWVKHGGRWATHIPIEELQAIAKEVEQLPAVIVVGEGTERFNVFHAEFHGNDQDLENINGKLYIPINILEGRTLIEGDVGKEHHIGLSPSFVGHTVVRKPRMIGSHIYLDTGSYNGEHDPSNPSGISVIEPATQQVWQYSRGKVIRTA